MTQIAHNDELWAIFDARRVKAPELRGLDSMANGVVGWFKNRRPVLSKLKAQVDRIERLEPEIHELSATRFREEIADLRAAARRGRLEDEKLDRAMAIT